MTSQRPLDLTISQSNVIASMEQFLCATSNLHPDEDIVVDTIEYNPKTKTFRVKGVAEKLDDTVTVTQLN